MTARIRATAILAAVTALAVAGSVFSLPATAATTKSWSNGKAYSSTSAKGNGAKKVSTKRLYAPNGAITDQVTTTGVRGKTKATVVDVDYAQPGVRAAVSETTYSSKGTVTSTLKRTFYPGTSTTRVKTVGGVTTTYYRSGTVAQRVDATGTKQYYVGGARKSWVKKNGDRETYHPNGAVASKYVKAKDLTTLYNSAGAQVRADVGPEIITIQGSKGTQIQRNIGTATNPAKANGSIVSRVDLDGEKQTATVSTYGLDGRRTKVVNLKNAATLPLSSNQFISQPDITHYGTTITLFDATSPAAPGVTERKTTRKDSSGSILSVSDQMQLRLYNVKTGVKYRQIDTGYENDRRADVTYYPDGPHRFQDINYIGVKSTVFFTPKGKQVIVETK